MDQMPSKNSCEWTRVAAAVTLAALLLCARHALAQAAAAPVQPTVAFDAASVKPATLFADPTSGKTIYQMGLRRDRTHGLLRCNYCNLQLMLGYAYELKDNQIIGPSWLSEDTFQVEARMPAGVSEALVRQMVQSLLVERFALQFHRERRMLPAYTLVVASKRPKLVTAEKAVPRYGFTPGEMDYEGISMADFAHQIAFRTGVTVVDKAGLEGFYRIKLKWENPQADTGPESEIFSALKAELGLELKPEKLDTEVFVVDQAKKVPIAN
jgi:uncharacterized protein (TIGR03435 family)